MMKMENSVKERENKAFENSIFLFVFFLNFDSINLC